MFKKLFQVDNKWFFTDLHPIFKLFLFFVKGDLIVLLPFLIIILLVGIISLKFLLILLGLYISIRYIGELFYWVLQQFHNTRYRPYDWGFKKLDNQAIYIMYQTFAIVGTVIGASLIVYSLLYLN